MVPAEHQDAPASLLALLAPVLVPVLALELVLEHLVQHRVRSPARARSPECVRQRVRPPVAATSVTKRLKKAR